MLDKLYSPQEVLNTFPDGHRPSLRRLIAKAKEAGACCKLGRGIGFTAEQVKALQGYISCLDSRSTRNHLLEQTAVHDTMRELSRKKP